jgi:hypothetical protein
LQERPIVADVQGPGHSRRDLFLEAAHRIGARIAAEAEWEGGACTWTVMSPDRASPESRVAVATRSGGLLYEGTAGIGLFLAELAGATGDREVGRAALGAVRHALAEGETLPGGSTGFHSGRVGIAWASVRAAAALGEGGLQEEAARVLEPMAGHETEDRGMDVIAGAAGAIPALLAMAGTLDRDAMLTLARAMGDHLLATAVREPEGWSWSTMPQSSARNLNGLAHGAAGFGHALMELFAATGEGRYLHGAQQAYVYERRTFSPEHDNWPDLRHSEISEYLHAGRLDELRRRIGSPEGFPAYVRRYMSAWCHGAPGIGLTRLRAWQLTGEPLYREEAEAAVRTTIASVQDDRMNYSLCHGRAGNCETLVYGAEILGDAALREQAEECMVQGWERWGGADRRWPCGTLGGVPDPGLLLGESGIGHFFLRLAQPSVPSVLLPVGAAAHARHLVDGAEPARREARELDAAGYFDRTLRAFHALGENDAALAAAAAGDGDAARSPVAAAAEAVERRLEAETDPERAALLEDAARLDRTRLDLWRAVEDFSAEFLEGLVRPAEDEVQWADAVIVLSERARLVHDQWDWDGWLEDGERGALPEPDDVFVLLQSVGGRVSQRRLSPFAAVVLEAVTEPANLDDVVGRVSAAVSGERPPERSWLEPRVLEQLRQAYRAGFVECEPAGAAVPG